MVTTAEIVELNKEFTITSWSAQNSWNPIAIDSAEGVYFWTPEGQRFLDWSSQLVNMNIGHQHPHVVKAIQEQAAKLTFSQPSNATEPRGRLGQMLAEVTPEGLNHTLFTTGGAEAIENAMKMARLFTGRQKILTRYRSYHGATFASASAGGDPRRLANEPGVPWIVRFPDPYAYQSPIYRGRTQLEGDMIIADLIDEQVQMEDPNQCAAIMIEGVSGTSGIIQPTPQFFTRLREICDKYGMLLIIDEVMSGFGRTGEWFGINHSPDVKVDIMAIAKGVTCGYIPLGGTIISDEIAEHFGDHTYWGGMTYSAHTLACAAGIATLEVYHNENLIPRAREMGKVLRRGLTDLAEKHPIIGDIRGYGLHQVVELTKNRDTHEPLSAFNKNPSEPMGKVAKSLKAQGMSTFVRWNYIFNCPPLVVNEAQIQEGIEILDNALTEIDVYYEG